MAEGPHVSGKRSPRGTEKEQRAQEGEPSCAIPPHIILQPPVREKQRRSHTQSHRSISHPWDGVAAGSRAALWGHHVPVISNG